MIKEWYLCDEVEYNATFTIISNVYSFKPETSSKEHNFINVQSDKTGNIYRVMCADNIKFWNLRTYIGDHKTRENRVGKIDWKYIVPFSKFNPNDLESNIKNSI